MKEEVEGGSDMRTMIPITYCSGRKNEQEELLDAIERYQSSRIDEVYDLHIPVKLKLENCLKLVQDRIEDVVKNILLSGHSSAESYDNTSTRASPGTYDLRRYDTVLFSGYYKWI